MKGEAIASWGHLVDERQQPLVISEKRIIVTPSPARTKKASACRGAEANLGFRLDSEMVSGAEGKRFVLPVAATAAEFLVHVLEGEGNRIIQTPLQAGTVTHCVVAAAGISGP